MLSIITINYNDINGLRCTLESVKRQRSHPFEYIVIDGGSTDGSAELLKEFAGIIDIAVCEPDKGIYNAMNKGVAKAHGDYVLFLNGGDTLASEDVTEKIDALLVSSDEDILIASVNVVDDGRITHTNHTVSSPITLFNLFMWGIPHQGTLTKRQLLLDNPFDENYRINSDFKFFLQTIILQNCSIKYVPELTIANYDHSGISSTNEELQKRERLQIYNELVPERIRQDYNAVFPHYYEIVRVQWLLKHKLFYKIYRAMCSAGRKITN